MFKHVESKILKDEADYSIKNEYGLAHSVVTPVMHDIYSCEYVPHNSF